MAGDPMNPATNRFVRLVVESARRVDPLQHAVAQLRHAMAHRHRLDLVVGHIRGHRLHEQRTPLGRSAQNAVAPSGIPERVVSCQGL
jgi:hypothetical protein